MACKARAYLVQTVLAGCPSVQSAKLETKASFGNEPDDFMSLLDSGANDREARGAPQCW